MSRPRRATDFYGVSTMIAHEQTFARKLSMHGIVSPSTFLSPTIENEDENHLMNLTTDGIKEGSYMISKHSDDLLGHHARQIFREKAASMRGENALYYYIKNLMIQFGTRKNNKMEKNNADNGKMKQFTSTEQLELDAHAFRKLIASDPAFECAISSHQVDALYHRMERKNTIRLQDFLNFCLLDQTQLKFLKSMQMSDIEISDCFKRLTSTGSSDMSIELLTLSIARELDVVLTTGEATYLLQVMDYDKDNVVKLKDFEVFIKDDTLALSLLHPTPGHSIIDLKISTSETEENNFKKDGYTCLYQPICEENSKTPIYLWYKRSANGVSKPSITKIEYALSDRDTNLVAKGYVCLGQDINRASSFGKHKYIWTKFIDSKTTCDSEIINLALSCGDINDEKNARLWIPLHRGFQLVRGNLIEASSTGSKRAVFLWTLQKRHVLPDNLVDPQKHDLSPAANFSLSPRAKNRLNLLHINALEDQVRRVLRRSCPLDQDGALNFGLLFDQMCSTKKGSVSMELSQQRAMLAIESFGLKMNKKDYKDIWEHMNPKGSKTINANDLAQFLALNETEIAESVDILQRSLTTSSAQHPPNYRLIFQAHNSLGDGRLSRSDFQKLFASCHLNFTNSELCKAMHRFDVNQDGVVDYSDFLHFITGFCDASSRQAMEVAEAADVVRQWAIEQQKRKNAKNGNIETVTAWKSLGAKSIQGFVDVSAIDRVLRLQGHRLDPATLQKLKVIIAPSTNGDISQDDFHSFVNHLPKKISTMVYSMRKLIQSNIAVNELSCTVDAIFDRLNIEGNGKLSLINFCREISAFAKENNNISAVLDIRDFVYLAQWTGSDCGGDGYILIDRFLAFFRDQHERRIMKNEFVTHYDSPKFVEGINALRDEIKRVAKTPDGKFDFMIPFKLFDKDNSGYIVLSELEIAIRELGIDRYLTESEIKSFIRRFDPNDLGGIDYNEFLRFSIVETSSNSSISGLLPPKQVTRILQDIIECEKFDSSSLQIFLSSLKRMFGMLDTDMTGLVLSSQFKQILSDLNIIIKANDMATLVRNFAIVTKENEEKEDKSLKYLNFCSALNTVFDSIHSDEVLETEIAPSEVVNLLRDFYYEYCDATKRLKDKGEKLFNINLAFDSPENAKVCPAVTIEEFKEIIWAAGMRHPYLPEELEVILSNFQHQSSDGIASEFSLQLFRDFLSIGPTCLFKKTLDKGNIHDGSLDPFIIKLHDQFTTYFTTNGKDTKEKLLTIFNKYDTNKSGELSCDEFSKVLQDAGLRHLLTHDLELLLLQFLDSNGNGFISFSEFLDFQVRVEEELNKVVMNKEAQDKAAAAPEPVPLPVSDVLLPEPSPPKPKVEPPSIIPLKTTEEHVPSVFFEQDSATKPAGIHDNSSQKDNPTVREQMMRLKLILRIYKLSQNMQPSFPFQRYFKKYRYKSKHIFSDYQPLTAPILLPPTLVTSGVFSKIIDKFLSCAIDQKLPFNMKEMDVDLLIPLYTKNYILRAGEEEIPMTNYNWFIADLNHSKEFLKVREIPPLSAVSGVTTLDNCQLSSSSSGNVSEGSDSDAIEDDLSSSSEDEVKELSKNSLKLLSRIISNHLKRNYKSSEALELLYTFLQPIIELFTKPANGNNANFKTSKLNGILSERKFYSVLASISMRLRKREAEEIISLLIVKKYGREMINAEKFFKLLHDTLSHSLEKTPTVAKTAIPTSTTATEPTIPILVPATEVPPPAIKTEEQKLVEKPDEKPADSPQIVANVPLPINPKVDIYSPVIAPYQRAEASSPISSAVVALSSDLADKLYSCFVSAAQRNVSGLKLLEKCDSNRTGYVSLLEFQTILRLMGCILSDREIHEVQQALGKSHDQSKINYSSVVHKLMLQQNLGYGAQSTPVSSINRQRIMSPNRFSQQAQQAHAYPTCYYAPANKDNAKTFSAYPTIVSQAAVEGKYQPQKINTILTNPKSIAIAMNPGSNISFEDLSRMDTFLQPFFRDLLHTRSISLDALSHSLAAYDLCNTGFITSDAFLSVMRRLDMYLPQDVASMVTTRFAAISDPSRLDYIDFCQLLQVNSSLQHSSKTTNGPSVKEAKNTELASTSTNFIATENISYNDQVDRLPKLSETRQAHHEGLNVSKSTSSKTFGVKTVFHIEPTNGWSCSVCFHQQANPNAKLCEICASENPRNTKHESHVKCLGCGFRNSTSRKLCELCSSPLS